MSQKGLSTIWVVFIIVILIGGGFLAWQRWGGEGDGGEAVPTDETADWQTYRNEEFGFEIKYPSEWVLKMLNREYNDDLLMITFFSSAEFANVGVTIRDYDTLAKTEKMFQSFKAVYQIDWDSVQEVFLEAREGVEAAEISEKEYLLNKCFLDKDNKRVFIVGGYTDSESQTLRKSVKTIMSTFDFLDRL